jgi:hypothetical protein
MQRYNHQGQRQEPILRTHDLLCHCIDQRLVLALLGLGLRLLLELVEVLLKIALQLQHYLPQSPQSQNPY